MNSSSRFYSRSSASGVSPEKIRENFSGQGNLFVRPDSQTPGAMHDSAMIRTVVAESMRSCGLSRAQIADSMTLLTGKNVTERQLNNFAAESRDEYRFPLELVRAFCAATGNNRLLICCAELSGLHVVDDAGLELMELGREYLRHKRAQESIAGLEAKLRGVQL